MKQKLLSYRIKKKKEGISKNRKEFIKNIIAEVKAFIILLE